VSTPGGIPPPPPAPPTTPQGGITIGSDGVPVPPPPPPPAPPVPGQPTAPQIQLRRVNWEKLQSDGLDGTIWRQVRKITYHTINVRNPSISVLQIATLKNFHSIFSVFGKILDNRDWWKQYGH